MFTFGPVWPTTYIVLYFIASFVTLVLCILIGVAIARTRKTPYPSRLLCIGLLCYNCLFLPCAGAAKLFPHEESFPLRHISRGFQTAAQIIVAFMAFERFFILNWSYYVYLKIPKRLIRKICLGIIALSFLQFVVIKGGGCYARGKYLNCMGSVYFPVMCLLVLVSSFAVFIQIYTIIRRKVLAVKQFKGTISSFMYLLNSAFFIGLYLGLSLYNTYKQVTNETSTGWLVQSAEALYVANCFIDALIYGLWFKEVRMETLKIVSVVLPFVKPYIAKMRSELYATAYELKEINNCKQN